MLCFEGGKLLLGSLQAVLDIRCRHHFWFCTAKIINDAHFGSLHVLGLRKLGRKSPLRWQPETAIPGRRGSQRMGQGGPKEFWLAAFQTLGRSNAASPAGEGNNPAERRAPIWGRKLWPKRRWKTC